jgi:AcrR family transcriptional regulator
MSHAQPTGRPAPPVRQRLLTAAEDLFYEHGIASVGVDAIVARAGVATASLYKNFGGKADLVAGYLRARDERWGELWEMHIDQYEEPCERVLAIFSALATWDSTQGATNGCAHLAALQQLPPDHPGAAVSRRHKTYLRDRLRRLVVETGCTEPEDTVTDLLLIYEGTLALLATDTGAGAVGRGRHLAATRLDGGRE